MSQIISYIQNSGPGGFVQTLTGNSGGAVPPTAGNINVEGDGTTITVVGNPGTSTLTISQVSQVPIVHYTNVNHAASPYTVLSTDDYISVDVSGGVVTLLFPNAPAIGRIYVVKDRTGGSATNNISVTTVGGAVTIDGATTYTMNTNFDAIQLLFNGTSYEVW